jgi:mannose-1-phosphate guanylyltransferase
MNGLSPIGKNGFGKNLVSLFDCVTVLKLQAQLGRVSVEPVDELIDLRNFKQAILFLVEHGQFCLMKGVFIFNVIVVIELLRRFGHRIIDLCNKNMDKK